MEQLSVCHKAKHGCIIMASGMGTRFGGNKLMAELDGVPLIQHVIQATDGLSACLKSIPSCTMNPIETTPSVWA